MRVRQQLCAFASSAAAFYVGYVVCAMSMCVFSPRLCLRRVALATTPPTSARSHAVTPATPTLRQQACPEWFGQGLPSATQVSGSSGARVCVCVSLLWCRVRRRVSHGRYREPRLPNSCGGRQAARAVLFRAFGAAAAVAWGAYWAIAGVCDAHTPACLVFESCTAVVGCLALARFVALPVSTTTGTPHTSPWPPARRRRTL